MRYSVLDLCPVTEGSDAGDALRNTLDLAQHAEKWGYHRFWLAEHHNMAGVASAATAVVIGYVAGGTKTIRVGSGGIMLPNHAPLVVAEQFGTLASLYPNRIDLGLGRAPGTDQRTLKALRRTPESADHFPQDIRELQFYLEDTDEGQIIQAVPGGGTHVPIYMLGSSLYGAQVAAAFGLPYAFASHFMPDQIVEAIHVYRTHFQPSDHPSGECPKPYVMLAMNVFAAETDEAAAYHFSSLQQQFWHLRYGKVGKIPAPVENVAANWTPLQKAAVDRALSCSAVGSRDTVKHKIDAFLEAHRPDELIVTATMYDHAARLCSFEIVADILKSFQ